jgi:hypothetical protein
MACQPALVHRVGIGLDPAMPQRMPAPFEDRRHNALRPDAQTAGKNQNGGNNGCDKGRSSPGRNFYAHGIFDTPIKNLIV